MTSPPRYVPGSNTASAVTEEDVAAAAKISEYRASQLVRLQGRAEKWIGGLTALTGLLTTAIVVKGPDSFAKLSDGDKDVIVALMIGGGLCLAIGIWTGYSAAHGNPFASGGLEDFVDASGPQVTGAAEAWRVAVAASLTSARTSLQIAAGLTIVGVLLLGAAVVMTWISPEEKDGSSSSVCVIGAGGEVVEVASLPDVTSGSITITSCPED